MVLGPCQYQVLSMTRVTYPDPSFHWQPASLLVLGLKGLHWWTTQANGITRLHMFFGKMTREKIYVRLTVG